MHVIERWVVREHLKKLQNDSALTPEVQEQIGQCLARPRLMAALHHRIDALAEQRIPHGELRAMTAGAAEAGGFASVFQWLEEHRAEIIAFVQAFVKLFGG